MALERLPRPMLCLVTDRRRYAADEGQALAFLIDLARQAAAAGVDLIQVRERGLDDPRLLDVVRKAHKAVEGTNTRILVNERLDVAIAAGADGVHLPASAMPARRVRDIVLSGFLIGRSVHSIEEAEAAEADGGCDFLIFGTVYATGSKPQGHPVAGIDALADVCARTRLPVLAIGGITRERLPEIARAGAAGFAAIGSFVPPGAVPAADLGRHLQDLVAAARRAFDTN